MPALALLYQHPPLVEALLDRLAALGVDVVALDAAAAVTGTAAEPPAGVPVVNRVGAYPAGGGDPRLVLAVRDYLGRLERAGRRVLNGHRSYRLAISKLAQHELIVSLDLRSPRTRPVAAAGELASAGRGLRFPLLFKPNVGGSGIGVRVLADERAAEQARRDPAFTLGVDGCGVVQEYHRPRDGAVVRLELIGGELLYATRQPVTEGVFNYCALTGDNAAGGAIEVIDPPAAAVGEARRILEASGSVIGAVEYLVSERDRERYYFDVNPFSNYIPAARLGFDPVARLARFLRAASKGDRFI